MMVLLVNLMILMTLGKLDDFDDEDFDEDDYDEDDEEDDE